jgi:protein gp37
MAETTGIKWTDSTFNPWVGCTKIAPGCDHCYAEAGNRRFGGTQWVSGPKVTRPDNWKAPVNWNKKATKPHLVFCGSYCDWADKNAPEGARERLWDLIRATPRLRWQLLTKRAPNIREYLPIDWGSGYRNVWLGVHG